MAADQGTAAGDGQPAIVAEGLSKYYGPFKAIKGVSFAIPRGQVVAFLGPNGAGKSTTMKILTGYMAPSAGTARVLGKDVQHHRREVANSIGWLPENGPLYADMTPHGLLKFFGDARGLSGTALSRRVDEVVDRCSLAEVLHKPISKLSKGFRQRVGMAQCLLHDPEVLIMDEPTSGLDPNQIKEVRQTIKRMGQSKTILLSTHVLQEVEAVADRVILINEGEIAFDGPVADFRAGAGSLDDKFAQLTGGAVATLAT